MLNKAISVELQKTLIMFDEFVEQVENRYLTED